MSEAHTSGRTFSCQCCTGCSDANPEFLREALAPLRKRPTAKTESAPSSLSFACVKKEKKKTRSLTHPLSPPALSTPKSQNEVSFSEMHLRMKRNEGSRKTREEIPNPAERFLSHAEKCSLNARVRPPLARKTHTHTHTHTHTPRESESESERSEVPSERGEGPDNRATSSEQRRRRNKSKKLRTHSSSSECSSSCGWRPSWPLPNLT